MAFAGVLRVYQDILYPFAHYRILRTRACVGCSRWRLGDTNITFFFPIISPLLIEPAHDRTSHVTRS